MIGNEEFIKVSNIEYNCNLTEEAEDYIDNIIGTLSVGLAEEFVNIHNAMLYDTLLGRYIGSCFINKKIPLDNHYGFAVINTTLKKQNRTTKISVGTFLLKDNQRRIMAGPIGV